MADIFISYLRPDIEAAEKLAEALEAQGWSVFWDRRIPEGRRFDDFLDEQLQASRCVIVLWTRTSIQSPWVRDEAAVGRERGILIPARLDDVLTPFGFRSISSADLIGWQGETTHAGFRAVVDAVASVIGLPEQTHRTPSFFRARGGKRSLNEAKMILVGFGGVGKTSVVNRIVLGKPFDPHEKKTEGITIKEWWVRTSENRKLRLHVWDFGGQEIMHATHQFFLTMRSLYLLVLNGRQGREDADAEYWLNMIKSLAFDSPTIVILNKIHEQPFDLNRRALQGKFPNIKTFIETDCIDDTGLVSLGNLIREETDRLPHLRDTYPAAWFIIKDRLEGMAENYLTFEAYQRLCAAHGEPDEEGQERLASFLHILGIALSYRDDPRLHNTHVLKPQWVTEGIYTILNAKQLAAENGEMALGQLKEILDPARYPPAQLLFLLELMRKFELCFRFPDEDDRFLVPELLDKQEPELKSSDSEELLTFEYRYPGLLPDGLLSRFIVRTSALSIGQPRWRSGVVLSFEGNRALVKGDPIGRKVRIAVSGPAHGRRRLLAIIRSDFERIHRSYGFQPEEMVPVSGHTGVLVPYAKLLVLERKGIEEIQEVFGDDVLTLNVRQLLDGVDLEGARAPRAEAEGARAASSAFVSYSHKDEALRAELETHLKLLKRQGLLDVWSDRCITAGSEWETQIDENLERADLILLLVSADFIASGYCWEKELKRAMERHATGEAQVIPIIVRECSWKSVPFGKLQALPEGGKAVTIWNTGPYAHDTPWTKVEEGIRAVLDRRARSGVGAGNPTGLTEREGLRRAWWSELREWFLP